MTRHLSRARSCQVIAILLTMTWFSYASMRCSENGLKHAACPMAAPAGAHNGHLPAHPQSSMPPCCQHVGPCEVLATLTGAPDIAPAVLPVLPIVFPDSWRVMPQPVVVPSFDATHGPPLYLRNASLLI